MLDQTFNKLKNIHNLYELKLPLLFLGLAVWLVAPIIGIFPLLLSIQLGLLVPRQYQPKLSSLNNLLLILVVLTISIYISSFDVFADTRVYLDIYRTLDTKGIFDNFMVEQRYEFVLFLLLYPIHILTNGSEYWCLLLFALLVNSIVVFYLSKNFSIKYYPTILIIIFSTYFYYSQIFYMRQFLAIILVLIATICLESNWLLFLLFSCLAVFCHTVSAIYIAILFIVKVLYLIISRFKIKLQKRDRILIYFSLGILLMLFVYFGLKLYSNPQQIYEYVAKVIELLPDQELGGFIQARVDNNDARDTDTFVFTIFRALATMIVGVFIVIRGYKKLSPRLLSLNIFYVMSLFQIAFIMATGFNQRIAFMFLAFYGLFFCIGLDDWNRIKPFGVISLLTMFMAAANTFNFILIQETMLDTAGWQFFEGQPLTMSIYDYIIYFFQST